MKTVKAVRRKMHTTGILAAEYCQKDRIYRLKEDSFKVSGKANQPGDFKIRIDLGRH